MSEWTSVKTLSPSKVRQAAWAAMGNDAWAAAERYMRDGFLPPYTIITHLTEQKPAVFTRRHKWVLSGAMRTVIWLSRDSRERYLQDHKALLALQRQYFPKKKEEKG